MKLIVKISISIEPTSVLTFGLICLQVATQKIVGVPNFFFSKGIGTNDYMSENWQKVVISILFRQNLSCLQVDFVKN